MFKRTITILTLVSFVLYLYGCSSSSVVVVEFNNKQIDEYKDSKITSLVTYDNKIYEFDPKGVKPKPEIVDSLMIGWAIVTKYENDYTLKEVKIPVSEIKTLSVEELDVTKGILSMIGVTVGVVVVPFLILVITNNFEFDLR